MEHNLFETSVDGRARVAGVVVAGFGRGSRQLGVPTANYDQALVAQIPEDFKCGVYYGWARVNDGDVHKCVINVGWCPFYQNKTKSFETHIIHEFDNDFYGETLRVSVVGYIRPEMNFDSLDSLIQKIHEDIAFAAEQLDSPTDVNL